MDEYERTISEVLSEREREKLVHDIEVEKITNQRNQASLHSLLNRYFLFNTWSLVLMTREVVESLL